MELKMHEHRRKAISDLNKLAKQIKKEKLDKVNTDADLIIKYSELLSAAYSTDMPLYTEQLDRIRRFFHIMADQNFLNRDQQDLCLAVSLGI